MMTAYGRGGIARQAIISTSYMPNAYTRRRYIGYVSTQLRKRRGRLTAEAEQAMSSAPRQESTIRTADPPSGNVEELSSSEVYANGEPAI
jgi:hypothetical protein